MTNYDAVLRANLERVFNERDAAKRAVALRELFVADPIMYEPDAVVSGQAAISNAAGKLLEQLGGEFSFAPEAMAVGHHGFACLRWRGGTPDKPAQVRGTDAAEIVDGRIARLWVLIDPQTEP